MLFSPAITTTTTTTTTTITTHTIYPIGYIYSVYPIRITITTHTKLLPRGIPIDHRLVLYSHDVYLLGVYLTVSTP